MLTISDIPVEVFLDNLLPTIPLPDLLRLAQANRFFNLLINDDTFWKKKLDCDYNFSGKDTARVSGWKTIYRGLHKPRVFVWGEKAQGRLGLTQYPKSSDGHVSAPAELRIPGVRAISLAAGGMSFHALDSEGDVYVWGTLDGSSYALAADGYSEPGKTAATPLKLSLHAPTRAISCGRLHAATLDANGQVWNFVSWGTPFRLSSLHLYEIVQIECGWAFTSALTKSGEILAWFPFAGALEERVSAHQRQAGMREAAQARDGVIRCETWDCDINVSVLPRIPDLPSLPSGAEDDKETAIIQIASMESHLIALTNKGHVLKFGVLNDEGSVRAGRWQYLPQFSDASVIRQNVAFTERNGEGLLPPERVKISHITAHFKKFVAYSTGSTSSSIVLIGNLETDERTPAEIIPGLQYRGVISVLIGDYHYAALTDSGDMLTWGQYSNGALGLGDPARLEIGSPGGYVNAQHRNMVRDGRIIRPPDVNQPTKVQFLQVKTRDGVKQKRVFCFAGTASGWHTGALVIDLDPDMDEVAVETEAVDNREEYLPEPSQFEHPPFNPGTIQPPRGMEAFRIGFAGRGAGRGLAHAGAVPPVEPTGGMVAPETPPESGGQDGPPFVNPQEPGDPAIVNHHRGIHVRGLRTRPRVGFPGRFMNRGPPDA